MQNQVEIITLGQQQARGRPASETEGAGEAIRLVRSVMSDYRLNEKALALAAGVDQSSVSRALNRQPPAWTPSTQILYAYAINVRDGNVEFDTLSASRTLTEAVVNAWDKTPKGFHLLLRVLHAFRELESDGE